MDRQSSTVSLEVRGICLSLAAGGTALVATAAVTACVVRLAWPSAQPLPAAAALAVALLTAGWCASIRAAWLAASSKTLGTNLHGLVAAVPFCSAILIARAVTFHPLSDFSTFLLWFATIAQEAITLSLFVSTLGGEVIAAWLRPEIAPMEAETEAPISETPTIELPFAEASELHVELEEEEEEETPTLASHVSQKLVRAIDSDEHQVHGLVRATFQPGQRYAYLHIGFCPPLPAVPHVELHQLEGTEVQIKTGQVLTNGVRFDLKTRETPKEAMQPVFEFMATCPVETSPLREAG